MRPEVVWVPILDAWGRKVGVRAAHPEGVVCESDPGEQCSCGRLNLGIVRE